MEQLSLQQIREELSEILRMITECEEPCSDRITEVHRDYTLSAKNLMRYLLLRSHDLRKYHGMLSDIGISSLRSAEGYVYSNLFSVVQNLHLIQGIPFQYESKIPLIGYTKSKELLLKHNDTLFQCEDERQFTEIMVTLPDEAGDDIGLIRDLALNGMGIARINLGHGDFVLWEKMITNIKQVIEETGERILIYMDLAGPKVRTTPIHIKKKKGKVRDRIPVKPGDLIILTTRSTKGRMPIFADNGEQSVKTEIGVSLSALIRQVDIGDSVLFDDGMIESEVIRKNEEEIELLIRDCHKKNIGSNKGINAPDTDLQLPALTSRDQEVLPFACQHADIIGYSFVRNADDVRSLYAALDEQGARNLGVVFKIENKSAFDNLPDILLEGMRRNRIGVMIARGDLAVEIGYERISEVQNEILWISEAAHIPVIWATQVLESQMKKGIPTRAEISDASQAAQAECIMLNKGPHVIKALVLLKGIIGRMQNHSFKKKNELRKLEVAKRFTLRLRVANDL